jgi:xylulokinase
MNCTLGTDLVRNALDIDVKQFDEVTGSVPPGSGGLLVLPFFNGERTPNLPNGKACIVGMSSHNCRKGHILRATVEGATYALRFGLDELGRLGIATSEIVLTGGGANSAAWRQMVADICDLPVTVLQHEEGASFGAALQALWMLLSRDDSTVGIDTIVDDHLAVDAGRSTKPIAKNVAVYEQSYAAYQAAVKQISPLYDTKTDPL